MDIQQLSSTIGTPWICLLCTKLFKSEDLLKQHIDIRHGQNPLECNICGIVFRSVAYLKRHMRTHDPKNLNRQCKYCKKTFLSNMRLNAHVKRHFIKEEKSSWVCDICGKVLASVKSLREHIAAHKGLKRLTCHVCGKGFIKACNLTVHLRTHTGEKPYECKVCFKAFTQSTTLVIHSRLHSGEKPFTCDLCGECFVSRHALNAHKKSKHKTLHYDQA